MDNKNYTGALIDDRPLAEKEQDYRHEEIAQLAGAPSFTKVKKVSELPFYERRDQDGSSTCMNQGYAKVRGIRIKQFSGKYVSLSGGFAYRRRANQNSEGMSLPDIMSLGKEYGLPFEVIDPSQDMSEQEILNAEELPYTEQIAKVVTDDNERYIYLPNDFDTIAEVVSQGYPVLIMIFTTRDEYEITPVIKEADDFNIGQATIHHGIAVHFAFNEGGDDYLLADESWGVPSSKARNDFDEDLKERGQRRLTREWFNARVYGAAYIRDLNYSEGETATDKPKHVFTFDMEYTPIYAEDTEVMILQDILKYEGVFPTDTKSSGWYGPMTRKAVGAFQIKHGVVTDSSSAGYGRVGPLTRTKLNELYG